MINYLAQHHADYQLYVSQALVRMCRHYRCSLDDMKLLVEQIAQQVELTDALMVDIVDGIVSHDYQEPVEMRFQYSLQHKPDFLQNLTDVGNVLNNCRWKPGHKYLTNYYKELGRVILVPSECQEHVLVQAPRLDDNIDTVYRPGCVLQ